MCDQRIVYDDDDSLIGVCEADGEHRVHRAGVHRWSIDPLYHWRDVYPSEPRMPLALRHRPQSLSTRPVAILVPEEV